MRQITPPSRELPLPIGHRGPSLQRQRGIVLISSLLLLLVVTIMALSMFRGFGMQERIAGNVREKQRALQAANSAMQYAEWWLQSQSGATFAVAQGNAFAADQSCTAATIDANTGTPMICTPTTGLAAIAGTTPALWPTSAQGVGAAYTPPNMNVTNQALPNFYPARPHFYIQDLGVLASGHGEVYKIDAYGYGLTNTAIAVVESTVAIVCTVCNVGGL